MSTSEANTCSECEKLKLKLQELEDRRECDHKELQRAQTLIGKLLMHINSGRGLFMLSPSKPKKVASPNA